MTAMPPAVVVTVAPAAPGIVLAAANTSGPPLTVTAPRVVLLSAARTSRPGPALVKAVPATVRANVAWVPVTVMVGLAAVSEMLLGVVRPALVIVIVP